VQNELSRRFGSNEVQFLDEEATPVENHAVENFNFVIAYDDLLAARRGMRVVADMAGRAVAEAKWRPLPWKFDVLDDPGCQQLAIADAMNADLIVISTNARKGLPPAVEAWIKSSLAQKRGHYAAVVAMLGPSDHLDHPDSKRLKLVRQATEAAGLDFFAPVSNQDDALEISIETSSAETGIDSHVENVKCDNQKRGIK